MQLQVLHVTTRKKVLGSDHPGTVLGMNGLAITYFR